MLKEHAAERHDDVMAGEASEASRDSCPVNSYTEWDPLEEVIVGTPNHAVHTSLFPIDEFLFAEESKEWQRWLTLNALYPKNVIRAACQELDEFIHILIAEGVTVRRPDDVEYSAPFSTPDWKTLSGFNGANPRDPFLIIGHEILETPMSLRSRYFEAWAYRSLFMEYFQRGARWEAAPKPRLLNDLYCNPGDNENSFILTDIEPVFDGADFVRCGRDIFGQLSHVTNPMGVQWLTRHLGDEYNIHLIENRDPQAVHIDTAFMPLAPGKVLVNPEFIDPDALPDILETWDILIAPEPVPYTTNPRFMSDWIGMNILMLDETRVIVEKRQEPLIRAFKDWGFTPIPCPFEQYYPFVGGFHCATLDVRRRGDLKSYF